MSRHYRFFVDAGQITEETALVTGEPARQITKVLRLKEGDDICLLDNLGNEYDARITSLLKNAVTARILEKKECIGEPRVQLTLAVCLPKGDKLDLIVQKCSELGISNITVVLSERCVARPDSDKIAGRINRWCRIAAEAAEQSGRGRIPVIEYMEDFFSLTDAIRRHPISLIAWEGENRTPIKEVLQANREVESLMLIVGPEGGLTQQEVDIAVKAGAKPVTLGKRTLRCETAAIAACAAIMYELEGEL